MPETTGVRATSLQDEIQQNRPFRSKGQEAYLALMRTADEVRKRLDDFLAVEGITGQQYNVLRILRGAGPEGLPTLSIGGRMIERTPGVTRLIDRMERKGWVTRERCTSDRRRVFCKITPSGLALLAKLDGPVDAFDDSLAEGLEPADLDELIGILGRVRAHLRHVREG